MLGVSQPTLSLYSSIYISHISHTYIPARQVIDNTVKSNELQDMIFWYRANIDVPPYLLGDRKLWHAHYKFYRNEEEMEKIRQENAAVLNKKARITHVAKAHADGTAVIPRDL